MARLAIVALALLCAAVQIGCGALAESAGVVTARTVAGTKIGALEGVTVETREGLRHKEERVIVDVDILHDVVVEQTGDFEVRISSNIIPPIRALILGAGPVAMDLKVVDIELSSSPDDARLKAIEVGQFVFVKHEGQWVLVLQMARTGLEPEAGSAVNAHRYVSYPSEVAQQMSREQAYHRLRRHRAGSRQPGRAGRL